MIFLLTISFIRSFLPIGAIHKGCPHREGANAALSKRVEIIDHEIRGCQNAFMLQGDPSARGKGYVDISSVSENLGMSRN